LTPANSTPDGPWLAPAAIVGILGAEQDGITGLMRGVVPIAIHFVIISGLLSLLFFALSRRPKPVASNEANETAANSDAGSDTETEAEPERQEPKL
ncbi:MAG TPA: hypothetical protein VFV64_05425, partial [Permianibacter sp.]|nr:hypothetical protein [Permianibacter sp.]